MQDEHDDEESALDAKRRRRWGKPSRLLQALLNHLRIAEVLRHSSLACRTRPSSSGADCGASKLEAERIPVGSHLQAQQVTGRDAQYTIEPAGDYTC